MKKCDTCKKDITDNSFIQVTFYGNCQRLMLYWRKPIQLEFCSFNCFQEYFNMLTREQAMEELEEKRRWETRYPVPTSAMRQEGNETDKKDGSE
jgi:hypothetical protein